MQWLRATASKVRERKGRRTASAWTNGAFEDRGGFRSTRTVRDVIVAAGRTALAAPHVQYPRARRQMIQDFVQSILPAFPGELVAGDQLTPGSHLPYLADDREERNKNDQQHELLEVMPHQLDAAEQVAENGHRADPADG